MVAGQRRIYNQVEFLSEVLGNRASAVMRIIFMALKELRRAKSRPFKLLLLLQSRRFIGSLVFMIGWALILRALLLHLTFK